MPPSNWFIVDLNIGLARGCFPSSHSWLKIHVPAMGGKTTRATADVVDAAQAGEADAAQSGEGDAAQSGAADAVQSGAAWVDILVHTIFEYLYDSEDYLKQAASEALRNAKLHMDSTAVTARVVDILEGLSDSDPDMRIRVLLSLGKLEPTPLAGRCLVAQLKALGKLVPVTQATFAHAILQCSYYPSDYVQEAASEALSHALMHMDSKAVAARVGDIMECLSDSNPDVRIRALLSLGRLDATALAEHADVIVKCVDDSESRVRIVALETLGKLAPMALVQQADAIVRCLSKRDLDVRVRVVALETLGKLAPTALAKYADAIVWCLSELNSGVQVAALKVLGRLEPKARLSERDSDVQVEAFKALGRRVQVVALKALGRQELTVRESDVQVVALKPLGRLAPTAPDKYANTIVKFLSAADPTVQAAAFEALGRLDHTALARHADTFVKLTAVCALSRLDSTVLGRYANVVVECLNDSNSNVRAAALKTLSGMDSTAQAKLRSLGGPLFQLLREISEWNDRAVGDPLLELLLKDQDDT